MGTAKYTPKKATEKAHKYNSHSVKFCPNNLRAGIHAIKPLVDAIVPAADAVVVAITVSYFVNALLGLTNLKIPIEIMDANIEPPCVQPVLKPKLIFIAPTKIPVNAPTIIARSEKLLKSSTFTSLICFWDSISMSMNYK
jgi:hypothetical protein